MGFIGPNEMVEPTRKERELLDRIAELERQLAACEQSRDWHNAHRESARAEVLERCLEAAPFMKTSEHDEAPQVCWNNGYNAGVADYKTHIRALGWGMSK